MPDDFDINKALDRDHLLTLLSNGARLVRELRVVGEENVADEINNALDRMEARMESEK